MERRAASGKENDGLPLPEPDVVTLWRWGRSVFVGPVAKDVLAVLRPVALVAARTPAGCVRSKPPPLPLPAKPGPVLHFPSGLEPAVHAALLAAGYPVQIQGEP